MIQLKPVLDRLYADFNAPDSATDPIQIVRRFDRPDDREVVGFISAALAFGRVLSARPTGPGPWRARTTT